MPGTRGNPNGELVGPGVLDKVEEEKRGRKANEYLQRAMDFYGFKGRIPPDDLDKVLAKAKEYENADKKGGRRRRRHTRRGRKSRSTRRR